MELPKEKTKPVDSLEKIRILIYSPPKCGKTTLASNFPDGLFLATEKGYDMLSVYAVDILSWKDAEDALRALEKPNKFKNIIIDIVDRLYGYCEDDVCKEYGVKAISEIPYGGGYALVRKKIGNFINRINQLGYGLVMISHSQTETKESKVRKFTRVRTSMGEKPENIISGFCDFILYGYINENGERKLRTKPSENVLAGDRTGKMSKDIDMTYEALLSEFNKAIGK
jgi:hypothetical protein